MPHEYSPQAPQNKSRSIQEDMRSRQGKKAPAVRPPVLPYKKQVVQGVFNTAYYRYLFHLDDREESDNDPDIERYSALELTERSINEAQQEEEDTEDTDDTENEDNEMQGGIAYIVNAILPASEVERIPEVIAAIIDGLELADYARIAVVLGINVNTHQEGSEQRLSTAMQQASQLAEDFLFPIGLVPLTFSGPFPYGTMRNGVLHSEETAQLTAYFTALHLHPYISFQDFDTGSRRVGNDEGTHIFYRIDELLSGISTDDETCPIPIRPLMIGGGYRPQPGLEEDTQKKLTNAEIRRLGKERIHEILSEYPEEIRQDMQARDQLARLHPLLPYAPEPNLFIDAIAAYKESPLTKTPLKFGPNAAEFTELGKRLGLFAAEELDAHYTSRHEQAKESIPVEPIPMDALPSKALHDLDKIEDSPGDVEDMSIAEKEKYLRDMDQEEIENELRINTRTNTHPVRGQTFLTDFENTAIATDLSRLAKGRLGKKKLQSHTRLGGVVDRVFESKKNKKGVSLATVKNYFEKMTLKEKIAHLREMFESNGPQELFDFNEDNREILGGEKEQTTSSALSVEFGKKGGPFRGIFSGIGADADKLVFTHFLSIQGGLQRNQKALFDYQVADARKITQQQLSDALKRSMPGSVDRDGNCFYNALRLADETLAQTYPSAQDMRRAVVDWILQDANLPLVNNFVIDNGTNIDTFVLTVATGRRWAGNAGDLVPSVVASALGLNLSIRTGGLSYPIQHIPNTQPANNLGRTATVYLDGAHYEARSQASDLHGGQSQFWPKEVSFLFYQFAAELNDLASMPLTDGNMYGGSIDTRNELIRTILSSEQYLLRIIELILKFGVNHFHLALAIVTGHTESEAIQEMMGTYILPLLGRPSTSAGPSQSTSNQ